MNKDCIKKVLQFHSLKSRKMYLSLTLTVGGELIVPALLDRYRVSKKMLVKEPLNLFSTRFFCTHPVYPLKFPFQIIKKIGFSVILGDLENVGTIKLPT